MSTESLADQVLPLIRTRAALYNVRDASAHGRQMHLGVDLLEEASGTVDPKEVHAVTTKAIASALKVISRADDSNGEIGDACRRLLALHPQVTAEAGIAPSRVVKWMVDFQFHNDVDFFDIDPVDYAPALGEKGMAAYRAELGRIRDAVGPTPDWRDRSGPQHSREWSALDHNDKRLAVLDRDADAVIRLHAGDGTNVFHAVNAANALAEIGRTDLAAEWAYRALDLADERHVPAVSETLFAVMDRHRPGSAAESRGEVFRRWPSARTADDLREALGDQWETRSDEVMEVLRERPGEAVLFVLDTLRDPRRAWELAGEVELDDNTVWAYLADDYGPLDPAAVLPVHARLVEGLLGVSQVRNYRAAIRRLKTMRKLAARTGASGEVDRYIATIRRENRHRRRLLRELDSAGLK